MTNTTSALAPLQTGGGGGDGTRRQQIKSNPEIKAVEQTTQTKLFVFRHRNQKSFFSSLCSGF